MLRFSIKLVFCLLLLGCSNTENDYAQNVGLRIKPTSNSSDSLANIIDDLRTEIERLPNSENKRKLEEKLNLITETMDNIEERDSVLDSLQVY